MCPRLLYLHTVHLKNQYGSYSFGEQAVSELLLLWLILFQGNKCPETQKRSKAKQSKKDLEQKDTYIVALVQCAAVSTELLLTNDPPHIWIYPRPIS